MIIDYYLTVGAAPYVSMIIVIFIIYYYIYIYTGILVVVLSEHFWDISFICSVWIIYE